MSGKKTKFLFVNHWALNMGGAEHSLLDILIDASKQNEVHLVTSEIGTLTDKAEAFGIHTHVVHCSLTIARVRRDRMLRTIVFHWRSLFSYLLFVFRLRNLIATLRPDCIHANVPKSHVAIMLIKMLGYKGPCVLHIREIFKKRSIPPFLYWILFRSQSLYAIAISQAVKKALPLLIQKKTKVIYNGIKIPEFKSNPGKIKEEIKFIYLGRVVPWKGCHHLIEAFSRVKCSQKITATLSIVGDTMYWDPQYREYCKNLIALRRLTNRCNLVPHTSDPYKVLREHHVFCIASDNEPFGRVAAEAHACSLPVISFDCGGIKEIVVHGETGYLVPFGNIELLTKTFEQFVQNPVLAGEMGKNGFARAQNNFNKDLQIPQILDYMKSFI